MKFSFYSFRARLLMLILLIALPALGLTLYTAIEGRRDAASSVQEEAGRLLRLASSRQEELIEQTRDLLTVLANLPAIGSGDISEYDRFFPALLEQYPFFINLSIASPDGDLLYSSRPVARNLNFAGESYFLQSLRTGDFAVGNYTLGRITGRPLLPCSYPVIDGKGKVQVVIVTRSEHL